MNSIQKNGSHQEESGKLGLKSSAQPQLRAGKTREWYEKLMREEPKFEKKEELGRMIKNERIPSKTMDELKKIIENGERTPLNKLEQCILTIDMHLEDLVEIVDEMSKKGLRIDHIVSRYWVRMDSKQCEEAVLLIVESEGWRQPSDDILEYSRGIDIEKVRNAIKRLCKRHYSKIFSQNMDNSFSDTGDVPGGGPGFVGGMIGGIAGVIAAENVLNWNGLASGAVGWCVGCLVGMIFGTATATITNAIKAEHSARSLRKWARKTWLKSRNGKKEAG